VIDKFGNTRNWYVEKSAKITPLTSITIRVGEQHSKTGGNISTTQVVTKEKRGGNISNMLMTDFHDCFFENNRNLPDFV